MSASKLAVRYWKLDSQARHLVQVFAVSDLTMTRNDLLPLSHQAGWTDDRGKPLTKTAIRTTLDRLLDSGILLQGRYSSVCVNQTFGISPSRIQCAAIGSTC